MGSAAGAFISGGIAGVGVVNIPETGGASLIAAGAINGAIAAGAGDAVKQGVDIAIGSQKSFSGKELVVNSAIGAVVGGAAERLLPNARISGVSSGKGNWKAAAQSVRTRIANGGAKNMSAKTAVKGALGSQAANAYKTAGDAATSLTIDIVCHRTTEGPCG